MSNDVRRRDTLRPFGFYVAASQALAWMPVFFMYFSGVLSVEQALALEAVYYGAVCAFEVPSGYLSDRWGRRNTLIVGAVFMLVAYALFVFGTGFAMLAAAQSALAAGLACQSGTDSSLLYETLLEAGRESEYGEMEARYARLGLVTGAAAAVAGGAVGVLDLRLAYVLSGVGALASLFALWSVTEPVRMPTTEPSSMRRHLVRSWRVLSAPFPRVVAVVAVVSIVVNHLPYEFYQGYLQLLQLEGADRTWESAIAGLHVAVTTGIGAWAAGMSNRWSVSFGLRKFLAVSVVWQAILMWAMVIWVHPLVVVLLFSRGVSSAVQRAPIRAALAPWVHSEIRATFLSLLSLAGRASFALVLLALAWAGSVGVAAYSSAALAGAAFATVSSVVVSVALAVSRAAEGNPRATV